MGSGSPEIAFTMNIRGGETLQYEVTTDNRYVLQQGFFEDFPAEISVSAEGTGCALYTVSGHHVVNLSFKLYKIRIEIFGNFCSFLKRKSNQICVSPFCVCYCAWDI